MSHKREKYLQRNTLLVARRLRFIWLVSPCLTLGGVLGGIALNEGHAQSTAQSAPPVQSALKSTSSTSTEIASLPGARRVFTADLNGDGSDELLIAQNQTLSAWLMKADRGRMLWTINGPGVAQMMSVEDIGRGPELLVAWGMGKGKLKAPLTLQAHLLSSGDGRPLWRHEGPRSQAVALQVIQADQDAAPELLFAHFIDKYHTRRVTLDALDQATPVATEGPSIRMGTTWLMAEVDDTPGLDEVIGRVYGDVKGEYGDLIIGDPSKASIVLPTERGVKGAWSIELLGSRALYFSDGWVAAYGKRARATLKRARWQNGRPIVEQLAHASDEFTFFDLFVREDPKRGTLLFAHGNKGVSLITPRPKGPWTVNRLLNTPPIVNVAVGRQGADWYAYTPHESGVKVFRLTLPPAPLPTSSTPAIPVPSPQ
jgi:hypothetical protein